jgi:hypothetical protein
MSYVPKLSKILYRHHAPLATKLITCHSSTQGIITFYNVRIAKKEITQNGF